MHPIKTISEHQELVLLVSLTFTLKVKHRQGSTLFLCSVTKTSTALVIVAFLENATIGYSESLCVCVCVCVCPCLCVCVFLHNNSKRNRSRNTKLEYIVVYQNSLDEFDIELRRIKVKVAVGVPKFSTLTTIQTVRSYSYVDPLLGLCDLIAIYLGAH